VQPRWRAESIDNCNSIKCEIWSNPLIRRRALHQSATNFVPHWTKQFNKSKGMTPFLLKILRYSSPCYLLNFYLVKVTSFLVTLDYKKQTQNNIGKLTLSKLQMIYVTLVSFKLIKDAELGTDDAHNFWSTVFFIYG